MEKNIVFPCAVTPEVFRAFALFDTFRRQKMWRRPLLFTLIFAAFAAACFAMGSRVNGAVLLGGVLLGVGLILPAGYFLNYILALRRQAKTLDPSGKRIEYTVHLKPDGISATRGETTGQCAWDQVCYAYRVQGCVYLYPNPGQAFLLPDQCGNTDAVWQVLRQQLPQEKLFDLRKEKT